MDPNDRKPSDPDSFGVGMLADGTLPVFTPAEYAARVAERNSEEAALDAEDDDLSDLDEISAIASHTRPLPEQIRDVVMDAVSKHSAPPVVNVTVEAPRPRRERTRVTKHDAQGRIEEYVREAIDDGDES